MLCRAVKTSLIILLIPFIFKGFSFISAQEKININTATLEQLEALTGIGPVYAQRIIDSRPFSLVDDLIRVSGIGEKTLQKIKEQGLAYVEMPEAVIPEQTPETSEETPLSIPDISYLKGVIISKLMPSPEGADLDYEYIELKNTNDFEIDLSGWILRDTQGSTKEYVLEEKIPALETLTFFRPKTKITLNNSGDGVELLNPLKEVIDFVDFGKAETGIAFIKTSSGWRWDVPEPSQEKSPVKSPSQTKFEREQGFVEIDLSGSTKKSNVSIYLTGFLVALTCSIIFFISKKKLYKDQYIDI